MAEQTAHPIASAWKIIPLFQSRDIRRAFAFYTSVLGFKGILHTAPPGEGQGADAETEATFCSVLAGPKAAANLYLRLCRDPGTFTPSTAMIAMGNTEHEAFYEILSALARDGKEVVISKPIRDEPWGYREFNVTDPDGNEIIFFRFLSG